MTLFSTIVASLYIFLEFLYLLGNICIRPISKIHVVKSSSVISPSSCIAWAPCSLAIAGATHIQCTNTFSQLFLRLETSPCSGRHRESMKITGKMDWNCCNWMSISDYYLRKWPAPDCPLNPLQRVALHTRHAGRVLPRLAQDSVTRRGLRIEDDHSRWAASTTARSVFLRQFVHRLLPNCLIQWKFILVRISLPHHSPAPICQGGQQDFRIAPNSSIEWAPKIFTPENYSPLKNIHPSKIFTPGNIHPLVNIHP